MKILSPSVHGVLDYIVVLAFASAPAVVGLSGLPATISYLLAIVHLGLTLATAFPLGLWKLVPLRVHGAIELVVSVVLVILPWILGFSTDRRACVFYVGAGIVIFLTWLLSDYASSPRDGVEPVVGFLQACVEVAVSEFTKAADAQIGTQNLNRLKAILQRYQSLLSGS
jgi:hypothetical protein